MMYWRSKKLLWAAGNLILGLCCTASVFGQAVVAGIAWEKYLGDDANWYESQVVATSAKGELLIGVRSGAALSERYFNPHIWSFNQNGEKVSEFEIGSLAVDTSGAKPEQLKLLGLSTIV